MAKNVFAMLIDRNSPQVSHDTARLIIMQIKQQYQATKYPQKLQLAFGLLLSKTTDDTIIQYILDKKWTFKPTFAQLFANPHPLILKHIVDIMPTDPSKIHTFSNQINLQILCSNTNSDIVRILIQFLLKTKFVNAHEVIIFECLSVNPGIFDKKTGKENIRTVLETFIKVPKESLSWSKETFEKLTKRVPILESKEYKNKTRLHKLTGRLPKKRPPSRLKPLTYRRKGGPYAKWYQPDKGIWVGGESCIIL